jgi:hypothetical protein
MDGTLSRNTSLRILKTQTEELMRSLGNIAPNEEFRCQDSQKPRIK